MSTVSTVPELPGTFDRIRALESQYLLQNYARYPLLLERGRGCYVYDASGKRYLDLLAGIGVNALGHAHPACCCTPLIFITTSIKGRWPNGWRR